MPNADSDSPPRPALDHPLLFWLAMAAAAVSLTVGVWVTVRTDAPLDFSVYYMAADLVDRGRSPYAVDRDDWDRLAESLGIERYAWPYRYSPHTAALVTVLLPLGAHDAMIVWTIVNALAFLGGALLTGAALGGRRGQMLALWALACFGPVYNSYGDGQVEGIAFLGLAAAFWGLARNRSLATGAGIAVAAVLKLVPVVLVGYLLWRRRWRQAATAIVAMAALTAVCLPVADAKLLGEWADDALRLTAPGRINVNPPNQTATGVVGRLLLDRTSYGDGAREDTVRGIALAFAVVLFGLTGFATWPRRRGPSRLARPARPPDPTAVRDDLIGFGMVLAASCVVGPFTYYHQFSWLLIPVVLLLVAAVDEGRGWVVAAMFGAILLVDLDYVLWVSARDWVLETDVWRALSVPFLFALAVWAGSWRLLRAPERVPGGAPTEPGSKSYPKLEI